MPTNRCIRRFRPLSTRALRALKLRDLNPVYTSWSAFNYYIYTSIDARLWRAFLLRRIVDGTSTKALKVSARFSVGVVLDREFFCSGHLETKERDWNARARHLASEISISEHTSSASLVAKAADNSLACFQVFERRYDRANCRIVASMLRRNQQ